MKTTYINLLVISIFALTAWEANAQIKTIENEDPLMEEIIVTANKREELLIDIPMAVVTMTGTELEARGIDTIQDLSFAVPGMTMREDGPGSYQIFLRGIANAYGGGALVSI
jgi:iron complex outermembrane recepter protein